MARGQARVSGRDMFPGHNVGAGKGDKPRHRFDQSYRDNHDAIDWSGSVLGWEQHDGKQVKRYGVAAPIADRAPHVRVK